jgi:HSP90 family molecular chaperone
MFSIAFTPPSRPDPNQRDSYYIGQETGFKQMAEVAADRNQKRQLELSRQNLELSRQQESRIARQQAAELELRKRQQALNEKLLPVEIAGKRAEINKTASMLDMAREELNRSAGNTDLQRSLTNALLATLPSTQAKEESSTKAQAAQTQRDTQKVLEEVEAKVSPAETRQASVTETPSQLDRAKIVLDNVGTKPVARAEEQSRRERQNAAEREALLLGQTSKKTRGFGISNRAYEDFLSDFGA